MNADIASYLRTEEELASNPYPTDVRIGCFLQGFYHPCDVLSREPNTEGRIIGEGPKRRRPVYEVRLNRWRRKGMWEFKYRWRFGDGKESVVTYLPSDAIRFFHGTYSSDQHLPGTFRKNIGVPDGMWPEQWKNLQ